MTSQNKNLFLTRRILLAISFITGMLLTLTSLAQPYTPESNSSVVDILPAAIVELSADIRRSQASRQQSATASGSQILRQAMDAYQVAVSSGEARAYGHTLSILQRWPESDTRPAMYHILLAAVLQHNHEFDAALAELQRVTASGMNGSDRSAYIQALMIQSQIGLVIGDYALVEQSCTALEQTARRAVFVNCQAQLDGVTGNALHALSLLTSTLRAGTNLNTVDYQELLTTAAVIAHRLGDSPLAESYYQGALRLSPTNAYLIVNYSTLLLELDRPVDVVALLSADANGTLNAEMNILLAKALRATGSEADRRRAADIVATLEQEFELAFMRNEAIPHKEYAQYALDLTNLPDAALSSAAENWSFQKEPSDTLLLARAATLNNDRDVLNDIEQWMSSVGLEDERLQAILASHRESSP